MKNNKLSVKDIVSQIVFLAIGIGIFIYVMSGQNLYEIKETLLDAKVTPILAVILVSLLGHAVRAYRWKILMDKTGKTHFWNLLFSLQAGYLLSLAIPRIGEFIKCIISAETEKKPVSYVFGTVMSERIIDLIVLILLTSTALIYDSEVFMQFWAEVSTSLIELWESKKWFVLGAIALVFVIILPSINKMSDSEEKEEQLTVGLKSAFITDQKGKFWLATALIWVCYFLTSYLLFFCFTGTSMLTLSDGFFTTLGGTLSRMVPISGGGVGAFHFVIGELLKSLGVEEGTAISYALLNHGLQIVFQITVGTIAFILLGSKIDLKKIKLKF